MTEQVIALFCLENMDYSTRTEASLQQIEDFVGIWDCDVSQYPEFAEYGIAGLYFEIDAEGNGQTFAQQNDAEGYVVTDRYQAYVYESDELTIPASAPPIIWKAEKPNPATTQSRKKTERWR